MWEYGGQRFPTGWRQDRPQRRLSRLDSQSQIACPGDHAQSIQRPVRNKTEVLAIHAGLECGLIGEVYPEMDMIFLWTYDQRSTSPDERLLISTVGKFWI
jgi:di/tripeptidase